MRTSASAEQSSAERFGWLRTQLASCRTCRLRTRYSSSTSTRSEARRSTNGRRCAGLSGTSSRVPRGCSTSRDHGEPCAARGARIPASSRAWPSPSPGEGKRRTPIQTRLPDLLSSPAESSVGQKGPDAGRNAAGRCPPRGSPPLGDDAQPLKEHGILASFAVWSDESPNEKERPLGTAALRGRTREDLGSWIIGVPPRLASPSFRGTPRHRRASFARRSRLPM